MHEIRIKSLLGFRATLMRVDFIKCHVQTQLSETPYLRRVLSLHMKYQLYKIHPLRDSRKFCRFYSYLVHTFVKTPTTCPKLWHFANRNIDKHKVR